MILLPYTDSNIQLIQDFIDETVKRVSNGVMISFTGKAQNELQELNLEYDITPDDVEFAILNLKVENYYRGIDPSGRADFNVCAFCTNVGTANIEIYLKYGLESNGLQVLIFSNHPPEFPMDAPFRT